MVSFFVVVKTCKKYELGVCEKLIISVALHNIFKVLNIAWIDQLKFSANFSTVALFRGGEIWFFFMAEETGLPGED